MIKKLKEKLTELSKELNSNIVTYEVNFWFGCSVSVKIGEVELNQNPKYDFFGPNKGISEKDLIELEKEGFLKKISELTNEYDNLEKSIKYQITNVII